MAFDALHPHGQHTPRAKTKGVVQRHLAAGAGLCGHIDALLAQQRRALVARIHALEGVWVGFLLKMGGFSLKPVYPDVS